MSVTPVVHESSRTGTSGLGMLTARQEATAPRRAEALRSPLQTASARPPSRPHQVEGDGHLAAAPIAAGETGPPTDVAGAVSLRARLTSALVDGETCLAEALATLVWRESGLKAAHELLGSCLDEASREQQREPPELLCAKAMTATVRAVLERLRAGTPRTALPGVVVLAVPQGDPHTLALVALAHQVEQAGRATLIVDDLPLPELVGLAARPSTAAVVISAHLPWRTGHSNRVVCALRSAHPDLLVVLGGPGMPRRSRTLGLLTDDVEEMLAAIAGRDAVLTHREREVMTAVAEGLTNLEIAARMGVSASTVKTHLDRVFLKTGTVHRAAAVAHALRHGWIA